MEYATKVNYQLETYQSKIIEISKTNNKNGLKKAKKTRAYQDQKLYQQMHEDHLQT